MEQPKKLTNKPPRASNTYFKYSSLGVEMIVTFLLCAWLGRKTDEWLQTEKPWATIAFLLLAVAASMSLLIKQLNR